nr:PREDICTED: interleukin-18 receptor 1-like isoform X1 [Lepisosteus oculatus]
MVAVCVPIYNLYYMYPDFTSWNKVCPNIRFVSQKFCALSCPHRHFSQNMKIIFQILIVLFAAFKERVHCCSPSSKSEVFAHEGELAVLKCTSSVKCDDSSLRSDWIVSSSGGFMKLTSGVRDSLIIKRKWLIILGVTLNDTGLYQCTQRCSNGTDIISSNKYNLTVYGGKCFTEEDLYRIKKNTGNSFTLSCEDKDIPLSISHITWLKDCNQVYNSEQVINIASLMKSHAGKYTIIYSYTYGNRHYNLSETTELVVKDSSDLLDPKIIHPAENKTIEVEIGKEIVINCTAVIYRKPKLKTLYWLKNKEFVEVCDGNKSVCCKESSEHKPHNKYHMVSSLVFKSVTKECLNILYTCKLDSAQKNRKVFITLQLKETNQQGVSTVYLWLGILGCFALSASTFTAIYIQFKIEIALLYRNITGKDDTVGDGKTYDAYVTYYKIKSSKSFFEKERKSLLEVLEEHYGYQLCIYERDVLPGGAFADTILEYIDKSRRLIMIPSADDPAHESQYELVTGLYNALVDKKIQIIIIQCEPKADLDSFPEPLRLLLKSNGAVRWKDRKSKELDSVFWRKLRYMMPAKKHAVPLPEQIKML